MGKGSLILQDEVASSGDEKDQSVKNTIMKQQIFAAQLLYSDLPREY